MSLIQNLKTHVLGFIELIKYTCPFVFLCAIFALIPWGIGERQGKDSGLNWAIQVAKECETTYQDDDYLNVAHCLEGTIEQAKDEQRAGDLADYMSQRDY